MSIQLCPVTNKFVWIREEDIGANVYTQVAGATTKAIICNMLILITWNPTMRPVRWDELREPRGGQRDDLMKPVASYPGQVISLCPLDRQDLGGREGRQAARLRLTCFIYLDGSFYHAAPPGPRLASKSNQIRRKHQQVWPGSNLNAIIQRAWEGAATSRCHVSFVSGQFGAGRHQQRPCTARLVAYRAQITTVVAELVFVFFRCIFASFLPLSGSQFDPFT